jgi:K+-transporting ATPase ATPase C chain
MSQLRPALVVLALLTLLTGVVYPLLVTGVAQAAFPSQANGSLVKQGDQIIGSSLIGQEFEDPKYFWGRLSATTPAYNAGSSSGSNLGPLNPALKDEVKGRVDALRAADPGNTAPIPVDLVTSSGSGLDPHISPAAARFQVKRVAAKRGIDAAKLDALVDAHVEGRALGVIGEPVVNVLLLNLALDKL